MNKIKYFVVVQLLFSLSLCKINNGQREKLLNDFLKYYYDSLPNQVYQSEEESLESTQQVIPSGEQFIAIPRDQPSAPCVGCASHVNPQAAGVSDLADLGVRHLDLHEPSVKHSLASVIDVERQVQVVNGVRYILTLSINSNNCTQVEAENCASSKICKITILAKPWKKLSNGGNYKAILANNCTKEWQFGDNGEVLSVLSTDDNQNKGNSSDDLGDIIAFDGDIQVKHDTNVQSQPNQERSLTDDDIKKIQQQIIKDTQFHEVTETYRQSFTTSPDVSDLSKRHVFKVESDNHNKNSIPVTESAKTKKQAYKLNQDKKKAKDEMLHIFYFSENGGDRGKRQGAGGKAYQDSTKAEYKLLAEESLRKYIIDSGITDPLEVAQVEKVSTQVVAGLLTRIDFLVSGSSESKINKCHSKIWEKGWENFKQITVTCESAGQRGKRQVGGLEEQDPTKAEYKLLAEESLRKYAIDSGITDPLEVAQVEKVSTQIVAGLLTRIDFLVSGSSESKINKCHSKIWEKGWENFKQITVTCESAGQRGKRQINGGLKDQDPTKAEYKLLAEESLRKYIIDSGITDPLEVAWVEKVSTQIVAGLLTRIDFLVSGSSESKINKCHSKIWEKGWENFKQITVTCESAGQRGKRQVGGLEEQDPTKAEYKLLAEESLRKYAIDSGITDPLEVAQVEKVSTQIVAGLLTRIDFLVSGSSESKINKCHSKIWEKGWENFKQITVTCESAGQRGKRQVGGLEEQDPTKAEYKLLAEESLRKYAIDSGITDPLEVAQVEKVSTQIVAGLLTRIDFLVSGSSESKINKCHSKIWEKGWENFKQITVTCESAGQRGKRQVGGLEEQDPTKAEYKLLAEESLRKYAIDSGITDPLEVAQVEKVSTQVVAGLLTRIDFLVSGSSESKINKCHSKIWEKGWENFKQITVTCESAGQRGKRQVGGLEEQDPTKAEYKLLAEESLRKYIIDSGITDPLEVAQVEKVSTQIVAGLLTRIDFLVSGSSESKINKCHSKIWEKGWENFKQITVTCESAGQRGKRQVGGLEEQDPTKAEYKLLAEESLRKYAIDSGITDPLEVAQVEKVSTQIVAGLLTRIDFLVSGSSESKINKCHSKIWEKGWENFKQITVTCENGQRGKRQVGGLEEQDPTKAEYKLLAEESLRKYIIDSGITDPLEVAQVEKVSTQVVAGLLTRIDFLVSGSSESKINKCHSKIWEKGWENFKQITVTCESAGQRGKRQVGGLEEQDPTKAEYKLLAEESLRKYIIDSGITDPLEVARVEKVSTQVVAGLLTRIDFLVSGSSESKINKCHSKIWEKGWENFKQITVTCESAGQRGKRQVGGLEEQDPTKAEYKLLAEESLRKYAIDSGITDPLEVAQVEKVSTQVVAGLLTRIDFLVSGSSESKINKCHSKIWEKGWENLKQITVTCESAGQRGKRQVGGLEEQDPTKAEYKLLAEESLRKYIKDSGITDPLEVAWVEKVSTQIVAGLLTRIDFLVSGSSESKINKCHSKIWEKGWENFKQITVTCESAGQRGKRQVGGLEEQDPTKAEYKLLAEESLRKYAIDSGITDPLEVAQVEKVSTQIVAGLLTRIDFLVSGSSESKINKCHSKIWEKGWENFKQITVTCENGQRGKRQVGGLEEQDPTKAEYKLLAEESLRKYIIDSGITDPLEVAQVEKVSTQVVAGLLTRIDFLVSGSSESKINKCHSKIWEKGWENFKQITVTCESAGQRGKRQVGGLEEQDPTKAEYKLLAEESLRKYIIDSGITDPLEVARVEKVSTQVVAGLLTRIDFLVSGSSESKINKCHSKIWEKGWENFKQITVTCESAGQRGKRQVGGLEEQDPTKAEYKLLAEESLRKYAIDSGITDPLEVAQVEKVSTQVVAGLLTRIDFLVSGSSESKINKCHSKIWEKGWENFKQITVTCESAGQRGKRQVGGLEEQDPTKAEYKLLAEESLRKYIIDSGITDPLEVAWVEKVSTQIVAGLLTRIDFLVSGSSESKIYKCHSKIWEKGWENFKQITVTCENAGKRQINGGLEDQDPTKAEYKLLAEESLRKYIIDSGITDPLEVAWVEKVSTQIVAGLLTRIDFLVSGSSESKINKCHSKIWEKGWENFKQITVTCESAGQRGKRQVGGLEEQDPTKAEYKLLAEESLRKYAIDSGITDPLEVAQVEKVSTQVVAGLLTRIDFLVSGSSESKINKCHSKIWEKGWENFKQITVTCESAGQRGKRQVGGLEEQDPTKAEYKLLAEESLRKYIIDSGITDPLEVAWVEKVSTQIVAGLLTRIDFLVSGSSESKINKCHSKIWEKGWENFKQITVTCESAGQRGKRQVGGLEEQDPTKAEYKLLAEESLRKYIIDSGITDPLEVAWVEKVSTQIVAGLLTRIDFLVSGSSESKINKCHSKIWEKGWENFKQITVTCENAGKRQIHGGLEDQDPTKAEYKLLAEESLRKYAIDSGITDPLEVAQVEKVSTQIVAGLLTRIDFLVSGSSESKINKCHSKIWEKGWENFKQITVTCESAGQRGKRQVGGLEEQDPTKAEYKLLAEESLRKYAIDSGITDPLEVAQVEKVSTQVVAGLLTRIDFLVSGSSESKINKCHSKIWEKGWENFKQITVTCESAGQRGKRQVGGLEEQDPTKAEYKLLAEESLRKYIIDSGITDPLEVAWVEKVSTQIVAGLLTRIDFLVSGSSESKINKCHSKIWEKGWENFKQITVTCESAGQRGKRQVGGLEEQDPNDPRYKALAEKSLQKYTYTEPLRVVQVEKVSTQVVAGSLTHIDFLVSGSSDSKIHKCHSEIWERSWENFEEITVSCENDGLRGKGYKTGGRIDQDPTDPQYKVLAEESLQKYTIDHGITQPLRVAQVEKVSTQVVAGVLTRIDFLVSGSSESKINKCHSEIWEKGWENFKQITVTCENDGQRGKRQIVGGLEDQDPTKAEYKMLAEESLRKYVIDSGITDPLEVARVEKVSTQIVAGLLTRIDFLVSGSSESKINKCHSKIWEKGWENFKQITVTCDNAGQRGKRQVGGLEEQDPNDPRYKALAEKSLQKYTYTEPLRVVQVEKVSTQVVAGSLTHIDFLVSGSSDSKIHKCHSEIWERAWENFEEITVSCENDGLRGKGYKTGGRIDQDPTDPQYKVLAEESLQKYTIDHGITQPLRVAQVEKVSTQVVAGVLTRIDFLVSGSSESKINKCHSEIWEKGWENFKQITVTCENDGQRGKRQIVGGLEDQDPTKAEYKMLAEESLRKYVIDSGITDPLEVARVEKVSTQIVAGLLTRIDFLVSGSSESKINKCHSKIWEKGWENFKQITVTCENAGQRGKRQVGGLEEQDPNDPRYKALAEKSLQKYTYTEPLRVVQVEKVSTEVVAGSLTHIDFLVSGSSDSKIHKCHSEIWERPWENFEEITLRCENDGHRGLTNQKKQFDGALVYQDPTKAEYKLLAEESLRKYVIDAGITDPLEVARVEKVSTQIVAGLLTRIDFLVSGSSDSKISKCHSGIWENAWEHFKQITVTCENDGHRGKMQLHVGLVEDQDPTKAEYKLLAKESLRKYVIDSGITDPLEVAQVERVSTQVVGGLLTRIDFLVSGSSYSRINKCHSEILERAWEHFKKIKVTCENDSHRGKRQVVGGRLDQDQDQNDPPYK